MKKVFVLVGSRKREGNTAKFIQSVTSRLDQTIYNIEFAFPQDYDISICDGNEDCFINVNYGMNEALKKLQDKVLKADILIVGSPVYVHSMSADLKLFIERSAWWVHTLRLQGKPVVVMSTCGSNGQKTVIEPLSEVMTFMGGNVIATANATQTPDHLNDKKWIEEVSSTIADRIKKYTKLPNSSNPFLEKVFNGSKLNILEQAKIATNVDTHLGELEYWNKTGMIHFDNFRDYLSSQRRS